MLRAVLKQVSTALIATKQRLLIYMSILGNVVKYGPRGQPAQHLATNKEQLLKDGYVRIPDEEKLN